jgi:hypothetical protein
MSAQISIQITRTFQFQNHFATDRARVSFHDAVDDLTAEQYRESGGVHITPETLCKVLTGEQYHSAGINEVHAVILGDPDADPMSWASAGPARSQREGGFLL